MVKSKAEMLQATYGEELSQFDVVIQTDGGCRGNSPTGRANNCPSAYGYYIVKSENFDFAGFMQLKATAQFRTKLTNNEAEVFALHSVLADFNEVWEQYLASGESCSLQFPIKILIMSDSNLIVNQVNGKWKVNSNKETVNQIKSMIRNFYDDNIEVTVMWMPREFNLADDICNLAMDTSKDVHVRA